MLAAFHHCSADYQTMWLRIRSCSPGDSYLNMMLRMMKAVRFSKCCFVFSLRQGTMLIAVIELSVTAIMLFLLLLAAMNTQEIASVAEAELEAMEIDWSSEFEDKLGLPFYYLNNERKMVTGQHLVSIMMTLSYAGVVLSIIHILSSLMLLYGALYDISNFLLPWLSTVLLSLVIASFLLMSVVFMHYHQKCIVPFIITSILGLGLDIYAWLVVFSYYREIENKNLFRDIERILQPPLVQEDLKCARVEI